jgi:hypothetical protein
MPSEAERADANLYANNVRALIAAELGVPATGHGFRDMLMQYQANSRGLPYGSCAHAHASIALSRSLTLCLLTQPPASSRWTSWTTIWASTFQPPRP